MILLLGGTSESLMVADRLTELGYPFVVSVISEYGAQLARQHAKQVVQVTFSPDSLAAFCREHQIKLILDVTHPFARVISEEAITCAQTLAISYLRFERPSLVESTPGIVSVNSMAEAIEYLRTINGPIYLSTGSKTAPAYAAALGVERLRVRVLPTPRVLENLSAAGYSAAQIDALQGPFSKNLNIELFKRAHAQVVVTKESGQRGGIQEKIAAAQALEIPCLIIRRPPMDYPEVVGDLAMLTTQLEVKYGR